jgi:hypothetical protein
MVKRSSLDGGTALVDDPACQETAMDPVFDLDGIEPDAEDDLREYIDRLVAEGCSVAGGEGADPVLIEPGGKAVETWREDYPYELMDRDEYEDAKYRRVWASTSDAVVAGSHPRTNARPPM